MPYRVPMETPAASIEDIAEKVWSYATRKLTNLDDARAALIDNLDVVLSSRLSKADFDTKLPDARAALIDEITAARLAELDPANIPADIDTILASLGSPAPSTITEIINTIVAWMLPVVDTHTTNLVVGNPAVDIGEYDYTDPTNPAPADVECILDLSNMQAGDIIVIKEYMSRVSPANYKQYNTYTFNGAQDSPIVRFPSRDGAWGWKITAQQTAGVNRTIYTAMRFMQRV